MGLTVSTTGNNISSELGGGGEEGHPDLGEHSVDHDDHGPHQLEAAAEEEEVGTSTRHDGCHTTIINMNNKSNKNVLVYLMLFSYLTSY